ncbi:MAG: hypothetical protein F4X97_10750, partial [Boseongicola sp. SB0662_bin_57]|nr:hypothetical protein [Boseongicola sp. SB0662_bin_57]
MNREIAINLGVDFGTRLTKVCVRSDEVGTAVVDFVGRGLGGALVCSVVCTNENGVISVPPPGAAPSAKCAIAYLKMALADRAHLSFGEDVPQPTVPTEEVSKALSAYFLSKTISRAKGWVLAAWNEHIGDRVVQWSGNVGLPVEHFDSDVRPKFQEVVAVAWHWSEIGIPEGTIDDLVRAYEICEARREPATSHFQACPEIAAAVMSFAMSRTSVPGIYVYFDVGGGTVDGVTFNLRRPSGEVHVNFYAGQVKSLGVDWIADDVCQRLSVEGSDSPDAERIKSALLNGKSKEVDAALAQYADQIALMAGGVIYQGKRKDGRNWREEKIQVSFAQRTLRRHLNDEDVTPLRVFVGGGGGGSSFYQQSISNGYERNTLRLYGIPPFDLIEVPFPADLLMGSVKTRDYHRFLIAYGLSVPYGEGPEIGLPSQFDPVPPRAPIRTTGMPDYRDHKDIFD